MPMGPGKYDDACTAARLSTGGDAVILIVLGGKRGTSFCVQSVGGNITAKLPAVLRQTADEIERSLKAGAP